MSITCEILAELTLDERAPEKSGRRLIDWARTCGVTGVVVPRRPWVSERVAGTLCHEAAGKGLRAYLERSSQEDIRVIEDVAGRRRITIGVNSGKFLGAWFRLRKQYGRTLGYTDSWPHPWSALNAALSHVPVIVKGLTLNRALGGPDHRGSLYPDELGALVEHVQGMTTHLAAELERAGRGEPHRNRTPTVKEHLLDTETLVVRRALAQGQVVQADDVKVVQGLRGLSGRMQSSLIGRRLLYSCQPDEPVTFGVVEPMPGQSQEPPLDISVVIRTKNEAAWLRRSLPALLHQRRPPKEILIVDNESTDESVAIAERFGCRIISISEQKFSFGRALNRGIAATSSAWVISLSAHCIPVHDLWLESFVVPEHCSPFVAAVYGRQEPLPDTGDFDKRDLWTTFGMEPRVQRGQDYFFHNANSLIRRAAWEEVPFDESLTGVEDRDWAKKILAEGWTIHYAPSPSVHHYHGIHQGRNESRARRVVQVIELIQQRVPAESLSGLSAS